MIRGTRKPGSARKNKVFGGMAASLDGFIGSSDGDLTWLNSAMAPGEDYGFAETTKRTGAYLIGANTYRGMIAMEMAGGTDQTPVFVVTHQEDLKAGSQTKLRSGDLRAIVDEARAATDKDVCVFGGGDLVTQLIALDLLDELTISIVPVILGSGTRFFGPTAGHHKLTLERSRSFPSGIVALDYRTVRGKA